MVYTPAGRRDTELAAKIEAWTMDTMKERLPRPCLEEAPIGAPEVRPSKLAVDPASATGR
jgi:hypothetical protein